MELGALEHQARVDFEHVGPEILVGEKPFELAHVLFLVCVKAGHHVVANFQCRVLEHARRVHHIYDLVPSLHARINLIIKCLHPKFDSCSTHLQQPVHILLARPVRPRLEGDANGPHTRLLVALQRSRKARAPFLPSVHRIQASLHEFRLIAVRLRVERAAHHDELALVHVMPNLPQGLEPRLHLRVAVEFVLPGAQGRRLEACVALRSLAAPRAVGAPAVRASAHRHDCDWRNARKRARLPEPEQRHHALAPLCLRNFPEYFGILKHCGETVFCAYFFLDLLQAEPASED
ncbi:Uncharacterised protein [Candidatus Burarchaeum australiense]|nr:Uncharacterised protein [Candidatus Burarchaeum australiense]